MQAVAYRKLSELVDKFGSDKNVKRTVWVKRFFEALDWGNRSAFTVQPDNGQGYRLLVDNFPVINVLVDSPSNVGNVYWALNKAYNQDVPWVIATDFNSLGLYGSYWVSTENDVSSALALKVERSDFLADAHHLDLLTPHSIARNSLTEFYSAFSGRNRRAPIDLHLVDRMRQWRELALSALGVDAVSGDESIHRLINTLFLIRYIEDSEKIETGNLYTIATNTSERQFVLQLKDTFDRVAERTGYIVPTKRELSKLDQFPLKNLMQQLYGYPDYKVFYNFAEMTVDVLGRFYEEYLKLDVVPVRETRVTHTLFEPDYYEFENTRRQRGIFYTPRYIVDYILNSLIERFKATHSSEELPVIVDLAAGSGTFLSAAVDHLINTYPKSRNLPENLVTHVVGFDIDPRAIGAASLNLTAKLISHRVPEPFPPLRLEKIDLIDGGPFQRGIVETIPDEGADIIVGNPPYIPYERLKLRYDMSDISALFETAERRVDSYIMFVEATVKLLKEGGLGGLVLPTSILRTKTAGALRQWLTNNVDLLEIIDFTDQPIFQSAGAYVCLILFRKRSAQSSAPRKVTVAKVYKISETPASQLAGISVAESKASPEGCDVFRVDQPVGKEAWELRNSTERELLDLMKESSDQQFDDVLVSRQGVKTGADDIFVVEATPIDTDRHIFAGSTGTFKLERDALIPVFRNRNLRRWSTSSTEFLIYPYDRDRQKLYPWKSLQSKYPGVAAYLESHRDKLAKRKSLRGKLWYELIEPRLQVLTEYSPRLAAAEISLRPIVCRLHPEDAALVGNAWLIGKNNSYDLDVLMAYINSIVAEWYIRRSSSLLQGGYILLRQQNLAALPLPRFLKDKESFVHSELKRLSKQLSDKSRSTKGPLNSRLRVETQSAEEQINLLVMEGLKLKATQADLLRNNLIITRDK